MSCDMLSLGKSNSTKRQTCLFYKHLFLNYNVYLHEVVTPMISHRQKVTLTN